MSLIRDKINSFDSSKENEQIIKEQLETLAQLADAQNTIDALSIETSLKDGKITDDLKIPITKVIGQYKETHVVTEEQPNEIVDKLSGSIGKFFNPSAENILTGIAGILGTALDALMGTGRGMEAKKSEYMVAVEYPAIIRFDFAMWVRNTRASGLLTHCKSVISVVAYKSAVDLKQLDFSTFVAIYAPVLRKAFGSDPDTIQTFVSESKNIYGMLADDKKRAVSAVKPLDEAQLGYHEHQFQSGIHLF